MFTPARQPAPEAKLAGKEFAAEARRRVIEHLPEILEAQFSRALDLSHPQGHAAAKDLLDRICPPESRQTLSGAPDALMAFTIVTGVPRAGD
ncbi:MAG: hypothetical protein INF89_15615 [Roseomonas sp.]|nr:hypothetical protein [Roseomonas sp.]